MNYSIIDLPEVDLLNETETRKYIKAAQNGDEKAVNKLVKHNLKLVLKVTYRFKNRDYELQDLFQTGVIGLIKAINGFDLDRNVKFSTYAFAKITGEIRLHLRDDEMINVSRSLKKTANTIRQIKEEMKKKLNREPTIRELEQETEIPRDKIVRAIESDKSHTSIYQPTYEDGGNELYLIDSIEDKDEENEFSKIDKLALVDLLKDLDPRSRKIIYLRYFEDKTQSEIGEEIGVSQVQISRLEKKILKKLKNKMQ